MITPNIAVTHRERILSEIQTLIAQLGHGKILGTAYDTAWGARLAAYYPQENFEACLEWLRRNQNEDGSWGGSLLHYHDRFVSTLAAIIALKEAGKHPRDARRVQRGENALWKLVGGLGRDDSDTVGFPILSAALADEATALGLDVPRAPTRFTAAYKRKVDTLLDDPNRNWLTTTLAFSFEALRHAADSGDQVLGANDSVAVSLSATAGYLMSRRDERGLAFINGVMAQEESGALPSIAPIDLFEIAWPLNYLGAAGAIEPDDPAVRRLLDQLWLYWSPDRGVGHSSRWAVPDIDDTAACYSALLWGGYSVSPHVFDSFELEDYFACYAGETNPSISAHVRLMYALRHSEPTPQNEARLAKALKLLQRFDENGSFWWDKWHASPYYVSSFALSSLRGRADELAYSRYKWILRTQSDDGGWGYLGESTPEETAYCLHTLIEWDRGAQRVDGARIQAGANYLFEHLDDQTHTPLWIGKSLYTPVYPVKAAILSALFDYLQWSEA